MEYSKQYLAAFGAVPKITTKCWQGIMSYFPNLETAWSASPQELKSANIPESFIVELLEYRKNHTPQDIWQRLQDNKIDIICIQDPIYPEILKEIHSPPFALYVMGEIQPKDETAIAVVGSRRCSDYGKSVTKEISSVLAKSGVTIISGLAYGIDSAAHQAALGAGGRTIAVIGSGLDKIYPAENQQLANRILNNGAIISEYPLGMPGLTQNFPARNRIISGLSQGVLIIEAGEKSGTIYTANFALEQNRQLYAIPGSIFNPLSAGPNSLIRAGAKPVLSANDILEDMGYQDVPAQKQTPEGDEETLIFEILQSGPKQIDEIAREAEQPVQEISQILSLMELKGKLNHLGGMVYALK